MEKDCCKFHFTSETERVRNIVKYLLEFVDEHAPAKEVRDDLRLVFSELLYNAVIHGNKGDANKSVHVKVKAEEDRIFAIIQDEGLGFDYQETIDQAGTEASLLNGNGRGIILVNALTDKLSFNKRGNEIRFEKKLK